MRPSLIKNLSSKQLLRKVPKAYRDLVSHKNFDGPVDLIIFPYNFKSIINSSDISENLDLLRTASNPLVAIGGCFTLEARAILKSAHIEYFSISEFPWTDKSQKAMKLSLGFRFKRVGI